MWAPSQPRMFCSKCGYALVYLERNRCPECGRDFDPRNRRSYLGTPHRPLWKWLRRVVLALCVASIILIAPFAWSWWTWRQNRRAVAALESLSATVATRDVGGGWMKRAARLVHLNPHLFERVVRVEFTKPLAADADLKSLAALGDLEFFSAQGGLGDSAFAMMPVSHLRELHLTSAGITDVSKSHLADAKNLEVLDLSQSRLTSLGKLRCAPRLRELWFAHACSSSDLVGDLSQFANLESLDLSNTGLSDDQASFVARLKHLRSLDVSNTLLTNAGLETLRSLDQLVSLNIENTAVTVGAGDEQQVMPYPANSVGRYSLPYHQPTNSLAADLIHRNYDASANAAIRSGDRTGVFPVVVEGRMFFQDGARIYGVELKDGGPIASWLTTHPDTDGQFIIDSDGSPVPPREWATPYYFSIAATKTCVLAIVGQHSRASDPLPIRNSSGAKLICLDAEAGTVRWTLSPHDSHLGLNVDEPANLSGTPLIVGEECFILRRTGEDNETCSLACVELQSGKVRWCTAVAVQTAKNVEMEFEPGLQTLSHPCYRDGKIFVQTNFGQVAAVATQSGRVVWTTPYVIETTRRGKVPRTVFRPFEANAPIANGGARRRTSKRL